MVPLERIAEAGRQAWETASGLPRTPWGALPARERRRWLAVAAAVWSASTLVQEGLIARREHEEEPERPG